MKNPQARANSPRSAVSSKPDEALAALALANIPGIGPIYAKRLVEELGSYQNIFEAGPDQIEKARVPAGVSAKIKSCRADAFERAAVQLRAAEAAGQRVVILTDPAYPKLLREIPDPPAALYIYGEATPHDGLSLGVVGTRKATPGGLNFAREISFELASAGITVVSGLALGIDSSAHRGALEADGGRTWAVLGSGADVIYPDRNRELYEEIRRSGRGVIASEFGPGTSPARQNFPLRNRIISGLSIGVLVVEAPEKSGALITAHTAVEQGREVFAVPQPARTPAGAGTNRLIREGAHLVEKVEDILSLIEHQARIIRAPSPPASNASRPVSSDSQIYHLIDNGVHGLDELVNRSGQNISAVLAELTRLEIAGRVRRIAASTYQAVGVKR